MDELIIKRRRPIVIVDTRTPEELAAFKSPRVNHSLPSAAPRKAQVPVKGIFKGKTKK